MTNYYVFEYVLLLYCIYGLCIILLNKNLPNWYFALTVYFGFKWIFNYRKCTISYIECKLRNVKKEYGYLYQLLDYIIDYRYNKNIKYVILLQILFVIYYCSDNYKIKI